MDQKLADLVVRFKFPIVLILLIWSVEIYETIADVHLGRYGVYPREWDGLFGIITSPYIHSDWEHLFSNSIPLFFLVSIMVFFYRKVALPSYIIIQLLTGFSVWLFARPSFHIGASGIVYGLVAFVFWSGIFRRNIKSIVLALIVVLVYSGYFYGIVPNREEVSWESHLFGGLVGIFTAFLFKDLKENDEDHKDPWGEEDEGEHFLPRDTFDYTIKERIERRNNEGMWNSTRTF